MRSVFVVLAPTGERRQRVCRVAVPHGQIPRPEFPVDGFADEATARRWAATFVHWYNVEHRHSGIRYVSPQQRHAGQDKAILAARHAVYLQARQRQPARWSGATRDWSHIGAVTLNPERDVVIEQEVRSQHIQQQAA